MGRIATYVLLPGGEVVAFYSLGMSEVLLRTEHRKSLEATHPRQGAVLILWLAWAAEADVNADTILSHAVGIAQIGARHVGAAVIALDPYDEATERFWRQRFGFRASLTRRADAEGIERLVDAARICGSFSLIAFKGHRLPAVGSRAPRRSPGQRRDNQAPANSRKRCRGWDWSKPVFSVSRPLSSGSRRH